MPSEHKSTGLTLLKHLAIRRGLAKKKKNPSAIIALTVEEAEGIINDFKEMKFQRDEAFRILKIKELPKG